MVVADQRTGMTSVDSPTELRDKARRILEFSLTVNDPEVLAEIEALAADMERRAEAVDGRSGRD